MLCILLQAWPSLEPLARNKDKKNAERSIYQHSNAKDHERPLDEELADVGFSNA